jgi:predicted AAA+ superfamily ATPase
MAKKLKPIPTEQIIKKLRDENPWWETYEIDSFHRTLKRRLYYELFFKLVEQTEVKRAVVLMGPRRVGKTVLMHHTIHGLLKDKKIKNDRVCFINIENPLYLNIALEELFKMCLQATGSDDPKGWFVFFDEIQYLPNWEVHLKVLVDSYPHTKFIVSGSAAATLKIKSNESGAGRFTDFMLPPLTFLEYIDLKGLNNLIFESTLFWKGEKLSYYNTHNIDSLNKHFVDYINFGGYPEVIFSEQIQSNMARYVKADIIDKVLLRDLPSLYGIRDIQELNAFFTRLVYYTACEVSFETLSQNSGVDKITLAKYIEYLEAAFLIKKIYRTDEAGKFFKRHNFFKIYLTNASLRSALFSPLEASDEMMGNMVETAIFSQWLHRKNSIPWYGRWTKNKGGEVDMVGLDLKKSKPVWAAEIKWSNKSFNFIEELKPLMFFSKNTGLTDVIATTLDKSGQKEVNGLKINYTPCSVYAINVALNTIRDTYNSIK